MHLSSSTIDRAPDTGHRAPLDDRAGPAKPASEPQSTPSPAPARNRQLDGVRGLAATAVIFYHAILHMDRDLLVRVFPVPIQDQATLRDFLTKLALIVFDGQAAVMIFFVLSGFVLHQSLRRETERSAPQICVRFIVHRLFRILPAVIVCMLVAYLISTLYRQSGFTGFPRLTFDQTWRNALLLQITFHGPSGSVQTELAAIPLLLLSFFACRRFGVTALVLCFLFMIIEIQNPIFVLRYANLWPNACAFIGGMLLASPEVKSVVARSGSKSVLALLAFFMLCRHIVFIQSLPAFVAQTICCVLLIGAIANLHGGRLVAFLQSQPLQFLGRISFSLYLLNVIVLMGLWSIPGLSTSPTHAVEIGLAIGVAALLLSLPLAYLSEKWVERPGIAWGRTFADGIERRL
ncbi:acyltransferase [Bradyrhizobium diazoefficiens]|nr:acyltransferase [Bradyrhizobium diazoefficiens]MBR0850295.1 acyltransferase [Bradyrhizobium diazoefficiens]